MESDAGGLDGGVAGDAVLGGSGGGVVELEAGIGDGVVPGGAVGDVGDVGDVGAVGAVGAAAGADAPAVVVPAADTATELALGAGSSPYRITSTTHTTRPVHARFMRFSLPCAFPAPGRPAGARV